eukprot:TRINITY_DN11773_c0_g1_i1.p1 TRINITY_DN11773_c0_g1~~TRINITY_DN11773_c0_g1_i1.p1  ORF type:complete len:392 (+),score=108.52 TRINITY_DN11773_c0_g1_i1:267-1442(+)
MEEVEDEDFVEDFEQSEQGSDYDEVSEEEAESQRKNSKRKAASAHQDSRTRSSKRSKQIDAQPNFFFSTRSSRSQDQKAREQQAKANNGAKVQKKEEKPEEVFNQTLSESSDDALKAVRCDADFAAVLQFMDLFRAILNLGKFSSNQIEHSLVYPGEYKFLAELHIKLLRGISVRKTINLENWEKSLKNRFTTEISLKNAITVPEDENPLESSEYYPLPVKRKILILRNLCDWQCDYNNKLLDYLKEMPASDYDGKLREEPIGSDRQGNKYWNLDTNDVTPRLYRESPSVWKAGKFVPGAWETVSSNIVALQEFAEKILDSKTRNPNDDEEELYEVITEDLIPPVLASERKEQAVARKLLRMETTGVSSRNILSTSRTRRSRSQVAFSYAE